VCKNRPQLTATVLWIAFFIGTLNLLAQFRYSHMALFASYVNIYAYMYMYMYIFVSPVIFVRKSYCIVLHLQASTS